MRKLRILVAASTLLLAEACMPSLHPYYTDKDVVVDPRLVGQWGDPEDDGESQEGWILEMAGDDAYALTIVEKNGKRQEFEAHLFNLGQEHFLDVLSRPCSFSWDGTDCDCLFMIPGHVLFRVSLTESELKVADLDFERLEEFRKANPDALPHLEYDDGSVVLTASTRELQRFVRKWDAKGKLFAEPKTMVRRPLSLLRTKEKERVATLSARPGQAEIEDHATVEALLPFRLTAWQARHTTQDSLSGPMRPPAPKMEK